jgi:hypothetical protein
MKNSDDSDSLSLDDHEIEEYAGLSKEEIQ